MYEQGDLEYSRHIESIKTKILSEFNEQNFESCISLCNQIISRESLKDDTTYDIYSKIFKALSCEMIEETSNAVEQYKDVLEIKVPQTLAMDDLWVYFFIWLSKSRLHFLDESKFNFLDIFEEVQRGFHVFPKTDSDFNHDLRYDLRINIFAKFNFILNTIFNAYWLEVIAIKNDWEWVSNYWLLNIEEEKVEALFWFKRTDFYWKDFNDIPDEELRSQIDNSRNKSLKDDLWDDELF